MAAVASARGEHPEPDQTEEGASTMAARFQREPREMNTVERAIVAALWFCSPEWRAIVEDVT
jgi:hypothetical protein